MKSFKVEKLIVNTRDTFGIAAKACAGITNGKFHFIFKDKLAEARETGCLTLRDLLGEGHVTTGKPLSVRRITAVNDVFTRLERGAKRMFPLAFRAVLVVSFSPLESVLRGGCLRDVRTGVD